MDQASDCDSSILACTITIDNRTYLILPYLWLNPRDYTPLGSLAVYTESLAFFQLHIYDFSLYYCFYCSHFMIPMTAPLLSWHALRFSLRITSMIYCQHTTDTMFSQFLSHLLVTVLLAKLLIFSLLEKHKRMIRTLRVKKQAREKAQHLLQVCFLL